MGTLAYLFPAFPLLHRTFVLREVLGLKRPLEKIDSPDDKGV